LPAARPPDGQLGLDALHEVENGIDHAELAARDREQAHAWLNFFLFLDRLLLGFPPAVVSYREKHCRV
jgi:hypothetical protein